MRKTGFFEIKSQRATLAAGHAAAVPFAGFDDQGVELVVVAGESVGRFVVAFRGESLLGEGLDLGVFCVVGGEAVANGDATEVFVDNHGGDTQGVEENGIGGFGANAGEVEEVVASGFRIGVSATSKGGHAAFVLGVEKSDEGFEGRGFAQHETRGADEIAELGFRDRAETTDGEDAASAQVGNGALDGFPGGILGEVGTDDDFEGCFRRPPLLRAPGCNEALVHRVEAASGGRHRLSDYR